MEPIFPAISMSSAIFLGFACAPTAGAFSIAQATTLTQFMPNDFRATTPDGPFGTRLRIASSSPGAWEATAEQLNSTGGTQWFSLWNLPSSAIPQGTYAADDGCTLPGALTVT